MHVDINNAQPPERQQVLQMFQNVTLCSSSPDVDVDLHTKMDVAVELEGASLFKGDYVDVPNCLADPVRTGAQQTGVERLTREFAQSTVHGN